MLVLQLFFAALFSYAIIGLAIGIKEWKRIKSVYDIYKTKIERLERLVNTIGPTDNNISSLQQIKESHKEISNLFEKPNARNIVIITFLFEWPLFLYDEVKENENNHN